MRVTPFLAFALLAGCSSGSQQILTGRVAPGFPVPITEIKVLHGGAVVAATPVAPDGTFRVAVQASSNLSIRLVGSAHSNVVMPRKTGAIASAFTVRAGGQPFNLGAIHYVGTAATTTFSFHDASGIDSECGEDDHDSTGATCVADDDGNDEDTCEAADTESESADSLTGSSSEADDGNDEGDSVPEHDFPEDGCSGTGSGSGSGSGSSAGSGV